MASDSTSKLPIPQLLSPALFYWVSAKITQTDISTCMSYWGLTLNTSIALFSFSQTSSSFSVLCFCEYPHHHPACCSSLAPWYSLLLCPKHCRFNLLISSDISEVFPTNSILIQYSKMPVWWPACLKIYRTWRVKPNLSITTYKVVPSGLYLHGQTHLKPHPFFPPKVLITLSLLQLPNIPDTSVEFWHISPVLSRTVP